MHSPTKMFKGMVVKTAELIKVVFCTRWGFIELAQRLWKVTILTLLIYKCTKLCRFLLRYRAVLITSYYRNVPCCTLGSILYTRSTARKPLPKYVERISNLWLYSPSSITSTLIWDTIGFDVYKSESDIQITKEIYFANTGFSSNCHEFYGCCLMSLSYNTIQVLLRSVSVSQKSAAS